jgi:hypothetical protein
MHSRAVASALFLVFPLAACSTTSSNGSPADISGNYSVSVTNTNNGCNYANWRVGDTAQNVTFEVTQSGDQASGNVRGLANIYFAFLGIGTLTGKVTGSSASLSAVGTTGIKQGQCAYFVRATADFSLTGNTINGTVTYRNETNHAADCGTLETCTSTQSIAGSRPPR